MSRWIDATDTVSLHPVMQLVQQQETQSLMKMLAQHQDLSSLASSTSQRHELSSQSPLRPVLLAMEGTGFGGDDRIANCLIGVPPAHPLMIMILSAIQQASHCLTVKSHLLVW
jgi:hypothetical protein